MTIAHLLSAYVVYWSKLKTPPPSNNQNKDNQFDDMEEGKKEANQEENTEDVAIKHLRVQ